MENLSPYLTTDPKPLLGLISKLDSEPDILARFQTALDGILAQIENPENLPNFSYRSLSKTHEFRAKKEPKTNNLQYEGILKRDWLRKHRELMPCVVVCICPFNTDWSVTQWAQQENAMEEQFRRIRTSLETRDGRLVLILVRSGVHALDKEILDDRLSSIKRKLQLDSSKFAYFTSPSELFYQNQSLKKIAKSIREYGLHYYNSHCKRCKQIIKTFPPSLSPLDSLVVARYNFKTAFYSEVLGQKQAALRHYLACFSLLTEQLHPLGAEWADQIKAVSEWCNFKICSFLLSGGSLKEAAAQLRSHTQTFFNTAFLCDWRHYHWMSNQYIIFNQLLDLCNIDPMATDADRGYYYFSAAKYATQRFQAFKAAKDAYDSSSSSSFAPLVSKFSGLVSSISRYIGAAPDLKDPNLSQQSPNKEELNILIFAHYLENKDENSGISEHTRQLISTAMRYIPAGHNRRMSFASSLLANVMILEEQFESAMPIFTSLSEDLTTSKWSEAAISYIQKRMTCAKCIGNLKEYLVAALILYTNSCQSPLPILSIDKKNNLDRDVMSILACCQGSRHDDPSSFVNEPDFGRYFNKTAAAVAAASASSLSSSEKPCKFVPGGLMLEMTGNLNMFDVHVKFFSKSMSIGSSVKVSVQIKSNFTSVLKCSKMAVHFFDETITKSFVDNGKSSGLSKVSSDSAAAQQISANLEFHYGEMLEFEFIVFVPETYMQNSVGDTMFGVQYVTLELAKPEGEPSSESSFFTSMTEEDRKVVFKLLYVSKEVVHKLENKRDKAQIKSQDFVNLFKFAKDSVILVSKPKALVEMVYPPPLSLNQKLNFMSTTTGTAIPANSANTAATQAALTMAAGPSGLDASIVNLLPGPIQRVNLVFKTNGDCITGGRFYLSSDLVPKSASESLFWYPDLESAAEVLSSSSSTNSGRDSSVNQLEDKVRFHPFLFSPVFQPSQPLLIPNQSPGSYFYIPIFVRSEQVGIFKLKFRLEYINNKGFSSYVSREYETRINFHRGLQVNFSFKSKRLSSSGIIGRDSAGANSYASASVVASSNMNNNNNNNVVIVKGDSVSMNVAIKSLETLHSSIEITDYFVNHSESILEDGGWISNENFPPFFKFNDDYDNSSSSNSSSGNNSSNTIADSEENIGGSGGVGVVGNNDKVRNLFKGKGLGNKNCVFSLKKGEVFEGNFMFSSLNDVDKYKSAFENRRLDDDENTRMSGVKVSFGEALVNWRIKDDLFLKPLDMSPFTSLVTVIDSSRSSSNDKNSSSSSSSNSRNSVDFSWIPSIARLGIEGAPSSSGDHALNRSVSFFRLCSSLFSIPAIELVQAPFEIFVDIPTSGTAGEEMQIVFHVYNRMFSTERLTINCTLHQDMLMTGPANVTIDAGIQAWTRVRMAMVPTKCGQIPLPNVVILWERYLNLGGAPYLPPSAGSPVVSTGGKSLDPGSSINNNYNNANSTTSSANYPPDAVLTEIGFPSDLRCIFVKPCEIKF